MSVTIPDEVLESAHFSPEELKLEIAIMLFRRGGLTLAQASRFCGLSRVDLQRALAFRQIPINYQLSDLESDIETLGGLDES